MILSLVFLVLSKHCEDVLRAYQQNWTVNLRTVIKFHREQQDSDTYYDNNMYIMRPIFIFDPEARLRCDKTVSPFGNV